MTQIQFSSNLEDAKNFMINYMIPDITENIRKCNEIYEAQEKQIAERAVKLKNEMREKGDTSKVYRVRLGDKFSLTHRQCKINIDLLKIKKLIYENILKRNITLLLLLKEKHNQLKCEQIEIFEKLVENNHFTEGDYLEFCEFCKTSITTIDDTFKLFGINN